MTSSLSSSSVGDGDKCPICLELIKGAAFLEPCFHRFCFHCILQWSEIIWATRRTPQQQQQGGGDESLLHLDCPLCKTPCPAAIHDVVSSSFDRHPFFPPGIAAQPKFRLSVEHYRRLRVYYPQNLVPARSDSPAPVSAPDSSNDPVRPGKAPRGFTAPLSRRAVERCRSWVRRELQALLREDDVDLLVHHFAGILEHFQTCKPPSSSSLPPPDDWKSVLSHEARRFIGGRTAETFVDELEKFLLSGLTIQAYDNLQSSQ